MNCSGWVEIKETGTRWIGITIAEEAGNGEISVKGTGAGWDSILYRVYIFGGLVGIVVVTVGTAIFFDSQGYAMLPVYAGGGCATLFLLGILVYWWIQILSAGYGDIPRVPEETESDGPELSALKSWSTLFEAMVWYGGNPDALKISKRKGGRPVVEWFTWATVLALFPIVSMWLYLFEVLSQESFLTYIRPAIVALAILMLIRTYFLFKGNVQSDEESIFVPLGLRLVAVSSAGTWLEGQRHGRDVRVVVDGIHCITYISAAVPRFEVESIDGKFQLSDNLPEEVHNALKGLRKAKRWSGVKVAGDSNGITIERHARGVNLWLYDLWLAERLATERNG